MDTVANKEARAEIAMIDIVAPAMACKIIERGEPVFGGDGTSNDHCLATAHATARMFRLSDGPEEVRRNQLARFELQRHRIIVPLRTGETPPFFSQPMFAPTSLTAVRLARDISGRNRAGAAKRSDKATH